MGGILILPKNGAILAASCSSGIELQAAWIVLFHFTQRILGNVVTGVAEKSLLRTRSRGCFSFFLLLLFSSSSSCFFLLSAAALFSPPPPFSSCFCFSSSPSPFCCYCFFLFLPLLLLSLLLLFLPPPLCLPDIQFPEGLDMV